MGHLGRRLGGCCCSVHGCREVHTCHYLYLNSSLFPGDAAQLHCACRTSSPITTFHCYRAASMSLLSLPPSITFPSILLSRDGHTSRMNTRSIATPATRLPEFESADNLLKSFVPLGPNTKKNGSDNKNSDLHHLDQLRRLVVSLHRNPALAGGVWKAGLVPKLIEFSRCGVSDFERQARMALALVGYAPPYSGRGLRILSVDGGGTR